MLSPKRRGEIRAVVMQAGRVCNRIFGRLGFRIYPLRFLPLGVDVNIDIKKVRRGRQMKTIFDVGSHRGWTVREFARGFPEADVFAFEPVGSTFAALQGNTGDVPKARLFQHGFGDAAGEFPIHLHKNPGENSLVREPYYESERGRSEMVKIETMDGFCLAQGVERIDLLKVDVEGFEIQVLRGAKRLLEQRRVEMVFVETGLDPGDKAHTFFRDLDDFLRAQGFVLFAVYDPRHWGNEYVCQYLNALYINLAMEHGPLPRKFIP